MKNKLKKQALLCIAGALFVGCSSELESTISVNLVKVKAIATSVAGGEDTRVAFTEDNEAHKLRITWKKSGEAFDVYVGGKKNTFTQDGPNAEDNRKATFVGSVAANAGDVCHAVYSGKTGSGYGGGLVLSVDAQEGSQYDEAATHMYAKTTYKKASTPLEFEFKQLTAVLKACVQFPAGVTGVATDAYLTADNSLLTHMGVQFTDGEPEYRVVMRNNLTFVDKEYNSTKFNIVDGKITVYANLFPDEVKNLRFVARVGGKYYIAPLMAQKTLKAGKWYYPGGEAKMATETGGYTTDPSTHTLHFAQPDNFVMYSDYETRNAVASVIDPASGLLKITGVPSAKDLLRVGEIAQELIEKNSTTIKVLDLSACTSLTAIPSTMMMSVSSLTEVRLAKSIVEIQEKAFENCSNLEKINLEGVKTIASYAFYSCKKIRTFNLPLLTDMEYGALSNTKFSYLNALQLETLNNVFGGATINGVVNLPKCKKIVDISQANDGQVFTLKLTRAGEIEVAEDAFA